MQYASQQSRNRFFAIKAVSSRFDVIVIAVSADNAAEIERLIVKFARPEFQPESGTDFGLVAFSLF